MNELYSIFCILMRRNGKVQLKNLVSMSGLPLSKARKLLCELCNTKKLKELVKEKELITPLLSNLFLEVL